MFSEFLNFSEEKISESISQNGEDIWRKLHKSWIRKEIQAPIQIHLSDV